MTYQFKHEPINDCHNFRTREECPMFEFSFDSGYCKLSKKRIYDQGRPEWCELVRVYTHHVPRKGKKNE